MESWKGIAAHLGRDVRTVQRWEKQEGLPVHRHIHNKLSSVYAYSEELNTWWCNRRRELEVEQSSSDLTQSRSRGFKLPAGLLFLVLSGLSGALLAIWLYRPAPAVELPLRRFAFTPRETVSRVAISPDGKHIAYIANSGEQRELWVQDLDREGPRRISGTTGAEYPFWSPDSQFIGFGTQSELRKVSILHDSPVTLCQLADQSEYSYLGGTWSLNGKSIVFAQGKKLCEVPVQGGAPKTLVEADPGSGIEHFELPHFLPSGNGRQLLVQFFEVGKKHKIALQSLDTGIRQVLALGDEALHPVYSPSGHVLYVWWPKARMNNLMSAVPFSLSTLRISGEAFPIAPTGLFPSVSKDGSLAYVDNLSLSFQLAWRDRGGKKLESIDYRCGPRFSLSPSGDRIALSALETSQIQIRSLDKDQEIPLVSQPTGIGEMIWTPDGKEITFAYERDGNRDIAMQPVQGGGGATILAATKADEYPTDWSADGRFLVYTLYDPETQLDIWYLKRGDGKQGFESTPFLRTGFREGQAKFSPDGRYLAYSSNESGGDEVYVMRFPEGKDRVQISRNGGLHPSWSRNGKELFYVEGQGLMAVSIATTPELVVGRPTPLFENSYLAADFLLPSYAVSRDGQRFLMLDRFGKAPQPVIRVVQNWYSEFRDAEFK
ncbi:MAG: hypothetical protein AB1898_32385 [Acidobacteriota bacterium]